MREFDVKAFGAVDDGVTLATSAFQQAVDAAGAAASPSQKVRVVVPKGRYVVGTVRLGSYLDFHLGDGAEIVMSTRQGDYGKAGEEGAIQAYGAEGLSITGTGVIDGQSAVHLPTYDAKDEWYFPYPEWRPRMMVLEGCRDLEVRGITMKEAPIWTLHLIGCKGALVDGVIIRNNLEVPNCDGIDPDHCEDVEIRNCDVACGDDGIVLKATRPYAKYGGCRRIRVKDCVLRTQDSGVKIGTETVCDIEDVVFERCRVLSSCRGIGIQLRDEGNVRNVVFRDMEFVSRYHSAPWWGRGEAISFTALPRTAGGRVGRLENVLVERVRGRAENSVRVQGFAGSRPKGISFREVEVEIGRWTGYAGGVFDNRPTCLGEQVYGHRTDGFVVESADEVVLKDCAVRWGEKRPEYFGHALAVKDAGVRREGFVGEAAHAGMAAVIAE